MTETRDFPTADVLSTITGILVGPIDGVYEVCQYMAGEPVFTHQLPRVSKEAKAAMLAARPELATACEESILINRENWQTWRDRWVERYGPTITVPRMTADQHERIEPISELAETVHPSKIISIDTGKRHG